MAPTVKGYLAALVDRRFRATALRVAGVVGSLLFVINHGAALVRGNMTPTRWFSAMLTYLVPYGVNVHGQYTHRVSRSPDSE
ncbi:hypothetical protein XM38_005390 [Halomicronema hongdechloris C2206]|uniref:Uncharacterized protein n=1 Tax=Halomicronema hongdechloris C2206 TaxID=1641165 RepID=A0A1V8NLG1_9CYAN|nr:nitrate/nitrite transporter NrtS [Halomicronema hongdechloris]ASC69611.1 hypothetical protein XM38_005390 [Halomicronema hongdechloris C2206]